MKSLNILPNEIFSTIEVRGNACSVGVRVGLTFLERECHELTEMQIATTCLQLIVKERGLFPTENPKLRFQNRVQLADWEFTAEFGVIEKPILNPQAVVEDLKVSLHDDDLVSRERCEARLIERIESQVRSAIPDSYLKSLPTPVDAIDIWSREIALAALADIIVPGSNPNFPRAERLKRATAWILDEAVTDAPPANP